MASFSERVTIYVETKVDNAKAGFAGLKKSIDDADGASGKLKAGFQGIGGMASTAAGALLSPAGLAAGVASVTALAGKAVGQFQSLGEAVGKFRDATGTTSEEASKLVEAFADLGIEPEKAAGQIGRMSKELGKNEEAFKQYGIEVVKAKDGTVDVTATLLGAVDALSKIQDPTKQATAAQDVFGRSWQEMSEVIQGGAPGLQAALDSVDPSKVLSDADVDSARGLRDAFDEIRDAGEGLMLTLGRELAPVIAELAPKIADLVKRAAPAMKQLGESFADAAEAIGPLVDGIGLLADSIGAWTNLEIKLPFSTDKIKPFTGALTLASDAFDSLRNRFGKDAELDASTTFGTATESALDYAAAAKAAEEAQRATAKTFADTATDLERWTEETAKALEGLEAYQKASTSSDYGAAALDGATEAMGQFNDQHFGLARMASDSEAAIDSFVESVKGSSLTFDLNTEAGRKNQAALEDVAATLETKFAAAYKEADGDLGKFKDSAEGIADETLKRLQDELGLSDEATAELGRQLGLTEGDYEARFKLSGDAEAKIKLGLLQTAIQNITDKDWQAKLTQQIIEGDYVGAVNTVQAYFNQHPAEVPTDVNRPTAADMLGIVSFMNQFFRNNPAKVPLTPVTGKYAKGGTVGTDGGIAGEAGPEFVDIPGQPRRLVDGATWVPAGARVTSAARTRGILQRLPRYAQGTANDLGGNVALIIEGNVYGDAHLRTMLDRAVADIAAAVRAGRRP